MGAGLSANERGRQEQRKQEAKRGTKSPRDCTLKMSVVTRASEAGEGTPRPWAGRVEAREQGMPVKMTL